MYSTTHLGIAALLLCRGYKVLKIEKKDAGLCSFYFEDDAEETADSFYSDAQVTAREYSAASRDIVTMMKEARRDR